MRVAAGEKLSDIASSGTEAERQVAAMAAQNKDDLFQDALDAVQASKYSPGRQIANLITPEQIEGFINEHSVHNMKIFKRVIEEEAKVAAGK